MGHVMTLDSPPNGFNIEIDRQPDVVVYSWRAVERHPLQWIPLLFGGLMLAEAVALPLLFFTNVPNDLDWWMLLVSGIFLSVVGGASAVGWTHEALS